MGKPSDSGEQDSVVDEAVEERRRRDKEWRDEMSERWSKHEATVLSTLNKMTQRQSEFNIKTEQRMNGMENDLAVAKDMLTGGRNPREGIVYRLLDIESFVSNWRRFNWIAISVTVAGGLGIVWALVKIAVK